jgi:hypothetical protein
MPLSADVGVGVGLGVGVGVGGEGVQMRAIARSAVITILVLLSAVILGLSATIQSAVTLAALATRALIVPGTGTPDPAPD